MTQEKETNRQAEQGKAETEIPCAVCRDLIPLVQDGGVGDYFKGQQLVVNSRA